LFQSSPTEFALSATVVDENQPSHDSGNFEPAIDAEYPAMRIQCMVVELGERVTNASSRISGSVVETKVPSSTLKPKSA